MPIWNYKKKNNSGLYLKALKLDKPFMCLPILQILIFKTEIHDNIDDLVQNQLVDI